MELNDMRKTQRVSIESLAESVGVSPSTVYGWFNGRKNPTYDNLIILADALGYELVLRKVV